MQYLIISYAIKIDESASRRLYCEDDLWVCLLTIMREVGEDLV